ncbi:MAG: hypothetical protein ABEK59_00195 [Halobacteria archaeon]
MDSNSSTRQGVSSVNLSEKYPVDNASAVPFQENEEDYKIDNKLKTFADKNYVKYVGYWKVVEKEPNQPPVRKPIYVKINKTEWIKTETAFNATDKVSRKVSEMTPEKHPSYVSVGFTVINDSSGAKGAEVTIAPYKDDDGVIHRPTVPVSAFRDELEGKVTGVVGSSKYRETRQVPVVVTNATSQVLEYYQNESR